MLINQKEFKTLIQEHQLGIWRYLRFLGCEDERAKDLTQDTFLSVYSKPFENRGFQSTASYLRNCARFLFLKDVRKQEMREKLERAAAADLVWQRHEEDGCGDEYRLSLDECLSSLDSRARSALEMRYRDGFSAVDLGRALGIKENSAKSILQRSKALLRACIERKINNE